MPSQLQVKRPLHVGKPAAEYVGNYLCSAQFSIAALFQDLWAQSAVLWRHTSFAVCCTLCTNKLPRDQESRDCTA